MWLLEEFKHFTLLHVNGRHAHFNKKDAELSDEEWRS
jgi:hypothetical protein